jgi:heptosyltransferase-1
MRKILIVRLGAMGDILHALPAVTAIRAALPDAIIGWVVENKWSELLAASSHELNGDTVNSLRPVVNHLHCVDTQGWRKNLHRSGTAGTIKDVVKAIRSMHYDLALDFQGAIKSAVMARLSGAGARAGFTDPRESAARFFYSERYGRIGEHVIEQNAGLASRALNRQIEPARPLLPANPAAERWADAEIARLGIASFVMMNPGAGWGAKQWPSQRYGEVAKTLAVHGLKTLVNAAPGEETLAQELMDAAGGQAFMIRCKIGELTALTRRARLFVGGDTGPLHLAAALGVPTIGLFGPTDPARTGPFGEKCIAIRHPESQTTFSHHREIEQGLLKITVEETISAARFLLGQR